MISASQLHAQAIAHLLSDNRGGAAMIMNQMARLGETTADQWVELAQACLNKGRSDEALKCIDLALQLEPLSIRARLAFAVAQTVAGQLPIAEKSLRELLVDAPDHAGALTELGYVLIRDKRADEAISGLNRATELLPRSARAWHLLGNAYRATGSAQQAYDCYKNAFAANPSGLALYDMARSASVAGSDFLGLIERYLGKNLVDTDRALAHFAAGKARDDLAEFDTAMDHFRKANSLQLRQPGLISLAGFHEDSRALRDLALPLDPGSASELPLFLIGAPRSGTSLCEQLVCSHSDVQGVGESTYLSEAIVQHGGFESLSNADADTAGKIAEEYLAALRARFPDAVRVADKMPDNAYLLGIIQWLLPNARVINICRHPLDIVLSLYSQSFAVNREYYCDLEKAAEYVKHYLLLMEYWKSTLSIRWMDIRYEELALNFETSARKLIGFAGLPWQDACLAFHRSDHAVYTASDWQVRQPVYKSSVYRWRNYARHLKPAMIVLEETIAAYEESVELALGESVTEALDHM